MRNLYKIANIALIFTLIGVFLCQDIAYSSDISYLRPPLLFGDKKIVKYDIKLNLAHDEITIIINKLKFNAKILEDISAYKKDEEILDVFKKYLATYDSLTNTILSEDFLIKFLNAARNSKEGCITEAENDMNMFFEVAELCLTNAKNAINGLKLRGLGELLIEATVITIDMNKTQLKLIRIEYEQHKKIIARRAAYEKLITKNSVPKELPSMTPKPSLLAGFFKSIFKNI
ncbi:MAG: hypothetical protein WC312_04355 [Candidatus Omnitrophota bacterium]|jgi:hypothetical protein